jgi:hypothetical protein
VAVTPPVLAGDGKALRIQRRSTCSSRASGNEGQRRGNGNDVCTSPGATQEPDGYYSVGAQSGRAEKGVHSGLYKMKHGFPNHIWDCIHKLLKCAEYAFNMFMDTEVIRHILQARQPVKF